MASITGWKLKSITKTSLCRRWAWALWQAKEVTTCRVRIFHIQLFSICSSAQRLRLSRSWTPHIKDRDASSPQTSAASTHCFLGLLDIFLSSSAQDLSTLDTRSFSSSFLWLVFYTTWEDSPDFSGCQLCSHENKLRETMKERKINLRITCTLRGLNNMDRVIISHTLDWLIHHMKTVKC